jgi:hypothetical protein
MVDMWCETASKLPPNFFPDQIFHVFPNENVAFVVYGNKGSNKTVSGWQRTQKKNRRKVLRKGAR